jgi:hypothetical protein
MDRHERHRLSHVERRSTAKPDYRIGSVRMKSLGPRTDMRRHGIAVYT